MSKYWCNDCFSSVEVEKISQKPGIAFVIFMLIFFMPLIGSFVGIPGLIISSLWWILTPSVCSKCKNRNIKKLKKSEIPTEAQIIAAKYGQKLKDKTF